MEGLDTCLKLQRGERSRREMKSSHPPHPHHPLAPWILSAAAPSPKQAWLDWVTENLPFSQIYFDYCFETEPETVS